MSRYFVIKNLKDKNKYFPYIPIPIPELIILEDNEIKNTIKIK
jgi:hypothetical protein